MVTVRLRTDVDLDSCVEVLCRVYAKDGYPVEGTSYAHRFLQDGLRRAWVAEHGDTIIGHVAIGNATERDPAVILWRKLYPDEPVVVLERLFVDPKHRGSGAATGLIRAVEAWSRQEGIRLILFALSKDQVAIRLYGRLGWTRFGTVPFSYGDGQQMDAVFAHLADTQSFSTNSIAIHHLYDLAMADTNRQSRRYPSNEEKTLEITWLDANATDSRPATQANQRKSNQARVSNAVLLTTELLENVFRSVPAKDLLLAQRVSPQWRDVIAGSRELQQLLSVFRPPPTPCCGMKLKGWDEVPSFEWLGMEGDEDGSEQDRSVSGDGCFVSWDL
ncbi:hypothetical protein LTR01_000239 [Friedmanniomyces endolithicus]|nr:hypothetical protein LTR01_000239 [Friedmanniomyces endolithicus]KAK0834667.1 hypothetical protein LTR73_000956 [Friedmanniomyces endolithicus]